MGKVWYIVKDDEHLGPYTYFDLKDLSRNKKIMGHTLVWKKGLKSAQQFSKIEDTSNKSLKDRLMFKKVKTKEQEAVKKLEQGLKLLQRDEFVRLTNETSFFNFKKAFAAFVITSFLGVMPFAYEVYQLASFNISRPSGLKTLDYERLRLVGQNAFEEITVGVAPSKDMSELVLATNFPFDGELEITIKSIQDKMIIPEIVVVKSRARLENRLAAFSSFQYEVGTRILPGYYQIEVNLVGAAEGSYWVERFVTLQKNLSQSTVELLSILPESSFDNKLVEAQLARAHESKKAWLNLQQRFLTIKSVVNQIGAEFNALHEKRLGSQDWDASLKQFSNKYERYFGSFLSSFVSSDYRMVEGFDKLDEEGQQKLKDYFEELSAITTQTATASAKFMHDFGQSGRKPSSRGWTNLKTNVDTQFETLVKRADDGLLAIGDIVK